MRIAAADAPPAIAPLEVTAHLLSKVVKSGQRFARAAARWRWCTWRHGLFRRDGWLEIMGKPTIVAPGTLASHEVLTKISPASAAASLTSSGRRTCTVLGSTARAAAAASATAAATASASAPAAVLFSTAVLSSTSAATPTSAALFSLSSTPHFKRLKMLPRQ